MSTQRAPKLDDSLVEVEWQWPRTSFEYVLRFYKRTNDTTMASLIASEIERLKRIERKLQDDYRESLTDDG